MAASLASCLACHERVKRSLWSLDRWLACLPGAKDALNSILHCFLPGHGQWVDHWGRLGRHLLERCLGSGGVPAYCSRTRRRCLCRACPGLCCCDRFLGRRLFWEHDLRSRGVPWRRLRRIWARSLLTGCFGLHRKLCRSSSASCQTEVN